MSGDKSGDKTAFRPTHTDPAPPASRAIATSSAASSLPGDEDKRLDDLLPLGISPLAPRGPGRPQGAKNRRTDLVASYLVDRFGDPLTAAMATASMPLRDLVRELREVASDVGMKLGATVMDVARFQRDCRNDTLPFIHAKRAPETAKGDPVVPIIGLSRFEQHNTTILAGGMTIEEAMKAADAQRQQNQGVRTIDGEVSHDEVSHDESNADE